MAYTIERLKGSNYDEFIDFIDLVFSQHSRPHHFQADLPLLFAPTDESMQNQYILRECGRICSAVGAIPYTYMIGEERFMTKTITNVATHHLHTGKGYMQALLARVTADMRQEDVDFATLHGNRERYRYWGFESAGVTSQAYFTRENTANQIKKGQKTGYHFSLLTADNEPAIRKCLEIFNREPQHYLRPEQTFMKTMHMWHAKPYLILDENNQFCGYLNFGDYWGGRHIQELLLHDNTAVPQVISSFLVQFELPDAALSLSPFNPQMMRAASQACESLSSNLMCRVAIYRLERLLAACLNAKQRAMGSLPEGEWVLQSCFGRHLIRHAGVFTVSETDRAPDLSVDGFDVYALLFGPSEYVIPYGKEKVGALGTWLPAPLYIHPIDRY